MRAASDILATIATAILTFLGVVFSITLVALQLASQQFSPRVTRTFVRAASTKVALGTFIATFVVSLLALTGIETGDSESATAPVASVTVAQVLGGLSLVVFIVFVNSTTRLTRINFIISAVAGETRHAIDVNHPPVHAYVPVEVPETSPTASSGATFRRGSPGASTAAFCSGSTRGRWSRSQRGTDASSA